MLFLSNATSSRTTSYLYNILYSYRPEWCCTEGPKGANSSWLNWRLIKTDAKMFYLIWSLARCCYRVNSDPKRVFTEKLALSVLLFRLCAIGFWANLIAPWLRLMRRPRPHSSMFVLLAGDKKLVLVTLGWLRKCSYTTNQLIAMRLLAADKKNDKNYFHHQNIWSKAHLWKVYHSMRSPIRVTKTT